MDSMHLNPKFVLDSKDLALYREAHPLPAKFLIPAKTLSKPMLVLDFDETLLHVEYKAPPNFDFQTECDKRAMFVQVRPHLKTFLAKVKPHYEVAVFTAAQPNYADPMLDRVDTERCIQYRFYRQHCHVFREVYVKDLETLGTPLERTLIVDNHPGSFMVHRNNGIPIKSYMGDSGDTALLELWGFLDEIKSETDMIPKAVQYANGWREKLSRQKKKAEASATQSYESSTSSGPQ
ncbi:probable C-terminal domain small phosphatase [Galendromus occidentalis]|uniref:Probable C-terminal domain small phosphatase n=1 Tax=Galendromus occidentalis TaxID=34638 RepID=A0AAJ6QRY7_9ACAR|nr:probable C-terminal domain small phosphatase [Galendromus occidentalis]